MLRTVFSYQFLVFIHDDINNCAMSVGWAQRFIVPTISRSVESELVGTIKRCAHPWIIHFATILNVVYS